MQSNRREARWFRFWPAGGVLLVMAACGAGTGHGAEPESDLEWPDLQDLKGLSLEELINQEVTIVSRAPEPISRTASAVQVVTGEMIHRSGALTLAEALRLAPNLQVGQLNAQSWAITARGFNGAPVAETPLANKLLVMIDGRTVYTPLFGGVFWDVQHVLLEDVDRIEVVSGPGGALWGANAVNGVINVVTKSARETQGLYLSGAAGTFLQDYGALRYGGGSSNVFYRVYAQRYDYRNTYEPDGSSAHDDWGLTQSGFRMDYYPTEENTLTFQGDIYEGREGDPTGMHVDGQNLMGKWQRTFSGESDLSLLFYYDRTWRHEVDGDFAEALNTFGLDFQHRFGWGERQKIVWGMEYRLMRDEVRNTPGLSFYPPRTDMQLFSGFVQDEIHLLAEKVLLTLGTKVEHNDYSGVELQPTARLSWLISNGQTLWGAVSRSVRSPARFDADVLIPELETPEGGIDSEKVLAYEIGYRVRPFEPLTVSVAGFYNKYDDLRSINMNPEAPPPLIFANNQEGDSWGVEISGVYQPFDFWRLRGGYTYFDKDLDQTSPAVLPGTETFEGADPQSQALLQSILNLPYNVEMDLAGRYVSALPATFLPTPRVPSYFTFDARLAWERNGLEVAIVGQNLWEKRHAEFGSLEIPRSVYGRITWAF